MGRKKRGKEDIESEQHDRPTNSIVTVANPVEESAVSTATITATTTSKGDGSNSKELDFAQRREMQRQQAAEKRRAKQKCYLCGKAGHVRRQCPGVQDDGRGMSRYKGKSNTKLEKQKYQARKNSKHDNDYNNNQSGETLTKSSNNNNLLEYPDLENTRYFDICCDLNATMEYLKSGRGKAKISHKEAFLELQQALQHAESQSNFGGMISKTTVKPNRPWIEPSAASISPFPTKTWYTVGLARDFLYNDAEEQSAIAALVESWNNHKDLIVGYWALLDYSPDYLKRPGCDRESQKRRVMATCQAARQVGLTVQLQVLPGAAGLDPEVSVAGTDYAQVLLDLQTILSDLFSQQHSTTLTIVLPNWSGMAKHMTTFLEGFSNHNLYIGLDGSVSFSKASILHECAFELPLERLVLETSTVIPSEIANLFGRDAFFHPGLWPFVAKAVAHSKKTVSVVEVAQAASENALKLYPQLATQQYSSEDTEQAPGEEVDHDGSDDDDDNDNEESETSEATDGENYPDN